MERPKGEYTDIEWHNLDAKAKSSIHLHLAEFVYFVIVGERIVRDVWDNLCSSYENKSSTNKVFLMKKLFDLCMKEEGTISTHINEFNIIFTQLTTQGLVFDKEIKRIFMLCNLPSSWDTFCIAISNSALGTSLVYNDVLGSLFIEEIHRKSLKEIRMLMQTLPMVDMPLGFDVLVFTADLPIETLVTQDAQYA
ncbi:hypothetical protein L7F22_058760 [Adiantum nelumboides]|nr:hypothetical protein [Adiantum nelumboides]